MTKKLDKKHILVVDDDQKIKELISQYLIEQNFIVTTAESSAEAKDRMELFSFDLIVLDIMMPGQDGLDLTREIRSKTDLPIILLTAKGDPSDRIKGLELGADDYVPKPFEPKELLLRIKNILSKIKKLKEVNEVINFGEAKLYIKKMIIKNKQNVFKINASEKKLLEQMILSAGKVFDRNDISKLINLKKERAVDVMITRLRQKIEPDPKNPVYLQTVRGNGYVLWSD
jgi:two-component system phosphate regulon response regulator OmpR|tara:strand:+ start:249 stop:935 length:687 start_codon:yes stop_codon:yes gene_type:complete